MHSNQDVMAGKPKPSEKEAKAAATQTHPKWKYHQKNRKVKPVLCQTPEDEAKLGKDWGDAPLPAEEAKEEAEEAAAD